MAKLMTNTHIYTHTGTVVSTTTPHMFRQSIITTRTQTIPLKSNSFFLRSVKLLRHPHVHSKWAYFAILHKFRQNFGTPLNFFFFLFHSFFFKATLGWFLTLFVITRAHEWANERKKKLKLLRECYHLTCFHWIFSLSSSWCWTFRGFFRR